MENIQGNIICIDRLKHSIAVARLMENLARTKIGWSDEKSKEMFTLGFLHDIGYEYAKKQEEHSYIGGEILKKVGYMYWREVYYHGVVTTAYDSDELKLLNIADFNVNPKGSIVTVKERLQDIEKRYGYNSTQYI